MLFAVKAAVVKAREKHQKEIEEQGVPVIRLTDTSQQWKVEKIEGGFKVSGQRIEKFAARTDFANEQGVRRLRDIMKKMGIMHELHRQGIEAGNSVHVGLQSFEY
jgi:GTP-binding protein